MSARNAPPVAAVVVGVLIAAAVLLVAVNRAVRPAEERAAPRDAVAPPAAHTPALHERALALEDAGRHADAAALLRAGLDELTDDTSLFAILRRVLPPDDKAELGERLARSGRPEEIFDQLIGEARAEGDGAAVAALFAGLKKARPRDHRWVSDEVRTHVAAGRFPAATALLRDRLPGATADSRTQMLLEYLTAMSFADRHADAYAGVPEADAGLAYRSLSMHLASRLAEAHGANHRGGLRALIDAHRGRAPRDPMLWYAEGALLRFAGEFERAEAVLAEGAAAVARLPPTPGGRAGRSAGDPEWDAEMFRTRRVEYLYLATKGLTAYETVGPPEHTFRQLAYLFDRDKDASALGELVAAHRSKFPAAPELPFWDADVLFLRGEYARAAAALEAFRAAGGRDLPERWKVYNCLVRSHLRAGDADAAQEAFDGTGRASVWLPPSLGAAVRAARGEADRVEAALAAQCQQQGGLAAFYADEDFARAIAAAPFADLRAKYPDQRPKK